MKVSPNHFCANCGTRLVCDPLKDWWECPCCGETMSGLRMASRDPIFLFHGEKCQGCDGEGVTDEDIYETHPYGDTYCTEVLSQEVECEECGGTGYDLDPAEQACIICGRDVEMKDDAILRGWHVHEECIDERTPKLEEWEAPSDF